MARVTDRNDWFDIWFADKQGMIDCMIRNMAADLEAGYDYFGNSIRSQREAIETWLKKKPVDPLSKKPLDVKDLIPNRSLKDTIQEFMNKCK